MDRIGKSRLRFFLVAGLIAAGVVALFLSGSDARNAVAGSTIPGEGTETTNGGKPMSEITGVIPSLDEGTGGEVKRVAYSHGGTELSLVLPAGWSHRICSAEECAEMDGMMRFGISFWPEEESGIELVYGCYDNAGMCGTGVTIEELTLDNGMKAWKYTEEYTQEHKMWMSVILEPDEWQPRDGSCMMECHIDLDQWLAYEDAIMEIVKTLDVSG